MISAKLEVVLGRRHVWVLWIFGVPILMLGTASALLNAAWHFSKPLLAVQIRSTTAEVVDQLGEPYKLLRTRDEITEALVNLGMACWEMPITRQGVLFPTLAESQESFGPMGVFDTDPDRPVPPPTGDVLYYLSLSTLHAALYYVDREGRIERAFFCSS